VSGFLLGFAVCSNEGVDFVDDGLYELLGNVGQAKLPCGSEELLQATP
jgi:hypothetical protein